MNRLNNDHRKNELIIPENLLKRDDNNDFCSGTNGVTRGLPDFNSLGSFTSFFSITNTLV